MGLVSLDDIAEAEAVLGFADAGLRASGRQATAPWLGAAAGNPVRS